jgi:hypothetical protein
VTVSVLVPVPVAGPRTAVRSLWSTGIGSKVGVRAGPLQPQQATANVPAAARRPDAYHRHRNRFVAYRNYPALGSQTVSQGRGQLVQSAGQGVYGRVAVRLPSRGMSEPDRESPVLAAVGDGVNPICAFRRFRMPISAIIWL